jgi:hypothetical protein
MSRLKDLQEKLAKRKDQPGFKDNVKALEEEIARLKEQGDV